jgi:hypothetical protein
VNFQILQIKQILKQRLKSKDLVMSMEQVGRREKIGTIKLLMEKILKA